MTFSCRLASFEKWLEVAITTVVRDFSFAEFGERDACRQWRQRRGRGDRQQRVCAFGECAKLRITHDSVLRQRRAISVEQRVGVLYVDNKLWSSRCEPSKSRSFVGTGKKAAHHSIEGVAFDEFGQTAIRLSDDEEDLLAVGS